MPRVRARQALIVRALLVLAIPAPALAGCGVYGAPAPHAIPSGSLPSPNENGDFNGDGHLDLVVGGQQGNTISVLLGDGQGGYQAARSYPTGAAPRAVVVADFDGDGDLDIANSNRSGSTNSKVMSCGSPPTL